MDKFDIELEMRSLSEKVRAGTITAEAGRKELDALRAQKSEIQKAEALAAAPIEKRSLVTSFADIRDAILEKRALTVNGTGVISQITQIVELIAAKTPLLQAVQYFYGPNASTNIPLLSPGLAQPATASEGYTTGSADSTAVLGSTSVTPVAYISTLPVSWEALNLSAANLESQFPQLFAKVFGQAMHKLIVDALFHTTGVASGNKIENAATGLGTIYDAANLAVSMGDYMDSATIVIAPATYKAWVASATEVSGRLYVEELIRSRTIEGAKVIVTSYAPTSVTGGVLTAVGGDMANFGVGVASSLMITPKSKVGDGNTYFDAAMYFGGKVIQNGNLFGLKAKASG
jgi:HK97 family phage major capsid protein